MKLKIAYLLWVAFVILMARYGPRELLMVIGFSVGCFFGTIIRDSNYLNQSTESWEEAIYRSLQYLLMVGVFVANFSTGVLFMSTIYSLDWYLRVAMAVSYALLPLMAYPKALDQ